MSEFFFPFKITCPQCGNVERSSDGCETDDWTEVFLFSGYSRKSAGSYDPYYTCRACSAKTDRDKLYRDKLIEVESIERVKAYLSRMLSSVIMNGEEALGDHGWQPDLDTVLNRYSLLFPDDGELQKIKEDYFLALHDRRTLTKFEPLPGTVEIGPENIVRKTFLEKVYLPNGLKRIASGTFKGCGCLHDLFIPDSVEEIGESAFEDCDLKTIHLSNSLTRIEDFLFKGCRRLEKVFLSDNIESIGAGAFKGCHSLKKPWLPGRLRIIGEEAFADCRSVTEVRISERTEVIGKDAFAGCPGITIRGRRGSAAEQYARTNGIRFVEN